MSYFAIFECVIDKAAARAQVRVGQWADEQARAAGHPPTSLRSLDLPLPQVDEGALPHVEKCVREFDWSQTQPGDDLAADWAGKLVRRGAPPTPHHVWHSSAAQWREPEDLRAARAAAWAQFKRQRHEAEFGRFTWDGSTFDADMVSQLRILAAAQKAQVNPLHTATWTLADNTTRVLNAAQLIALGDALHDHVAEQHARGRLKRAQLNQANSLAALLAVKWL